MFLTRCRSRPTRQKFIVWWSGGDGSLIDTHASASASLALYITAQCLPVYSTRVIGPVQTTMETLYLVYMQLCMYARACKLNCFDTERMKFGFYFGVTEIVRALSMPLLIHEFHFVRFEVYLYYCSASKNILTVLVKTKLLQSKFQVPMEYFLSQLSSLVHMFTIFSSISSSKLFYYNGEENGATEIVFESNFLQNVFCFLS